jgi:hypothetical protein
MVTPKGLFSTAGKMPTGRAGETPATRRVAASKFVLSVVEGPQALGMVASERSLINTGIGLTGLLDCVFHPGTGVFLGTFFAAVFG